MNILQGRTTYWCTKLLLKWPRTSTPKGFKNPLSWKRACMLINLLDPGDIVSKELLDMVSPTTNVDTTVRQVFQTKTNDVPIFLTLKFLFYHLKCIRRGFLARNRYNNYPVWILFWSLRRRLISENVQAVCHYPKIVYAVLGYWPMANGLK